MSLFSKAKHAKKKRLDELKTKIAGMKNQLKKSEENLTAAQVYII